MQIHVSICCTWLLCAVLLHLCIPVNCDFTTRGQCMLRWHQELHRREAMTSYSVKQLRPLGSERGEPTHLCDVLQMCLCSIGSVRGYVNVFFCMCVCLCVCSGCSRWSTALQMREPGGRQLRRLCVWLRTEQRGETQIQPLPVWTHSNTLWAVQNICNFQQSLLCSVGSRDGQRDFSIEMETEEEWEALSLNPNQPLITRKVYFYSLSRGNDHYHHLLSHLLFTFASNKSVWSCMCL